jgi:hypothetical protein
MNGKSKLDSESTASLKARLANGDYRSPGEKGDIARILQTKRGEGQKSDGTGELKPGLLKAQMDWIDSL